MQSHLAGAGNNVARAANWLANGLIAMSIGDAEPFGPWVPFTPRSNYFGMHVDEIAGGLMALGGARGIGAKFAGPVESGVWRWGPGMRGEAIERMLGQNLPQGFPVIDRFANGIATSIKSLDLTAATYQKESALSRTVTNYIDKVAAYRGTGASGNAGVRINANQISGRALDLAVPGRGTAMQQAVLQNAAAHAESVGVTLNVIIVR